RFALALPETCLALFIEDIGDVDAGTALDLSVAVAKRHAQQARQVLAHGTLAGAHGSDQEDSVATEHTPRSIPKRPGRPKAARRLSCSAVSVDGDRDAERAGQTAHGRHCDDDVAGNGPVAQRSGGGE